MTYGMKEALAALELAKAKYKKTSLDTHASLEDRAVAAERYDALRYAFRATCKTVDEALGMMNSAMDAYKLIADDATLPLRYRAKVYERYEALRYMYAAIKFDYALDIADDKSAEAASG
jgi:hypothetical protein